MSVRLSDFSGRMAAVRRRRPWLAPVLLLSCLNAGFYLMTQGPLASAPWLSALGQVQAEAEINPQSIHLLTAEEAVQLQVRIALEAKAAQLAAQAEAKARASEREIVLEFEPAPKPPKRSLKGVQPIVKLRLKNQRG